MINLLPNEEKKKNAKGFYFRFVVVLFAMLGIVLLIATVALLPSYFFSNTQKRGARANLEKQNLEEIPVVDAKTEGIIKDLNDKMTLIEGVQKNKFIVSEKIINQIILRKRPDIKISKILYQNNNIKGRTLEISGIAPSRAELLLFRQALESDINFKNVDLPISNFIKGSNIVFSLSLVPA